MFETLPEEYGPETRGILERFMQENTATLMRLRRSRRRPNAPRNLQSRPGSMRGTVTWNSPQQRDEIDGWRVYRDNESNLILTIRDPNLRQAEIIMISDSVAAIFISSYKVVGGAIVESPKLPILVRSNDDKFVVDGTAGETSGTRPRFPAEWGDEPDGGDSDESDN